MRRYMFTLRQEDVGTRGIAKVCPCCQSKSWIDLGAVMGRVQPRDVGKRVYEVDGVLQVENDQQLRDRVER